ncbi:MAG: LysM peptidoglycan-binding domain-containing protein [Anaerolineales bacterium]
MIRLTTLRQFAPAFVLVMLFLAGLACARPGTEEIIYVTATFPGGERVLSVSPTPDDPTDTPIAPTANPTRSVVAGGQGFSIETGSTYTVQQGDTLAEIAQAAGVPLADIIAANNITNPNLVEVGQQLAIPQQEADPTPAEVAAAPRIGPDFKLVPDSEVVYSPTAADFDVADYMKTKTGFLRAYSEEIGEDYVSGIELLAEVAQNYSVNPRVLLALLEYRGGWLNAPTVSESAAAYPMGLLNINRAGLYDQLLDTANALNFGYYGWKYRGINTITFADGRTIEMAPSLNPGTAAVQYFLSRDNTVEQWLIDVSAEGFFQQYLSLFGDPFLGAYEPLIPANLRQPELALPFPQDEIWFYTGGPHGGYNNGSAWASIDFAPPAPPDELIARQGFCYVSPFVVTAVAPGVIARAAGGFVILDLDMDGNEYTGWTIVYLHIADNEAMVEAGTVVETGDTIGNPSCEGGFSSATHLHFGRRYNGEWMPIDCFDCPPETPFAPMVLGDWRVGGFENAEYQGFMEGPGDEFRRANQGRIDPINQISWLR